MDWAENVEGTLNGLLENLDFLVGGREVGVIGMYLWARMVITPVAE